MEGEIKVKIEILGTGCSKCTVLERNVRQAVEELGMNAEIRKVEDVMDIVSYGVMATPALVIDGNVASAGRLLNPEEIKAVLQKSG